MLKRSLGWLPLLVVVALFVAMPLVPAAFAQHADEGQGAPAAEMAHEDAGQMTADSSAMAATEEHAATSEAEAGEHGAVEGAEEGGHGEGPGLGGMLPLWSALPFVGILLSIALFPLFAPSFWHHHFPKVSAFWALVFAIPFLFVYKGEAFHEIVHIYLVDYIPFIILLLGLFTASGGILLRGTLVGTPKVNLTFLVIGTILASWMGTTGAAMVLIRPLLRANRNRKTKMHVVIFFIFLLGIVGAVLFSGVVHLGEFKFLGVHLRVENEVRDLVILLMVFLSWKTTKMKIRKDNGFTWFPIQEVAYLFAGIFMTIIPALAMLRAGTHGHLAGVVNFVREPFHYFWVTGSLSSFLDNAPTYLTFYNLAQGRLGLTDQMVNQILTNQIDYAHQLAFMKDLMAISAGAVFFGAMTYIGNAPNFMVRSIAEENHVKMPSFFGYMLWSLGILVPVFLVITFIFFL